MFLKSSQTFSRVYFSFSDVGFLIFFVDFRIKGSVGFQHTINNSKQFVHADSNGGHFAFAFVQIFDKGFLNNGIMLKVV